MGPPDFDAFFRALHGNSPFPWQARLAHQVASEGRWPSVLSLPTSSGKTAVIDIAIFALALQAGETVSNRTAPLRTYFIIDRRIVVDEAFDRARRIQKKLLESGDASILDEVARRLRFFGGEPLQVAALRGGMYRDNTWAKSPAQPMVCISTVDQVGSRLLFRGYGVSEYQRAIHAGLVGNDSLLIVDEAHLSQPFLETLDAVHLYRARTTTGIALSTPFEVVRMSATVQSEEAPFELDPVRDYEDAELGRRLSARKLARRVEIAVNPEDEDANRKAFTEAAVREAKSLAGISVSAETARDRRKTEDSEPAEPVRVVGIVVNRVAIARMIFEALRCDAEQCYVVLLTGRIRPYDRDELLYRASVEGRDAGWFPYMEAVKDRPTLNKLLFVVATQTIEVGANLSFDALVTEAAPLDALRQRFGRLDRLGLRRTAHAVILARKDQVGSEPDPIYGKAIGETWKWLKRQQTGAGKKAVIDFGLTALKPPKDPATIAVLCSERQAAPVLLPAHIDILVQTSPTPEPDPDISVFLHGPDRDAPDVQIVWRADLPDVLRDGDQNLEDYVSTVATVPPTSMEALTVPIFAARKWLAGLQQSDGVSDIEGAPPPSDERRTPQGRLCLSWRGPEESKLIHGDELRPGTTIIVPASCGGADEYGWNPASTLPVHDVADPCSLLGRRVPVLRLQPDVVASWERPRSQGEGRLSMDIREALKVDDEGTEPDPFTLLQQVVTADDVPQWVRESAVFLGEGRRPTFKFIYYGKGDNAGVAILGHRDTKRAFTLRFENREPEHSEVTNEDDTASMNEQQSLSAHSAAVKELAERFARLIGLPSELIADLALAGWLHDLGKADARFQAWLWDGDQAQAETATELRAKSDMNSYDRAAIRRARERAGYPAGGRHEILSVALASSGRILESAYNRDLVLHAMGTHHGRGRPFVIPIADNLPIDVALIVTADGMLPYLGNDESGCVLSGSSAHGLERLDSGWVDRFWLMVRQYGWWGLALLEGILQLADHRCSEARDEGRRKNARK